MIQVVSLRGRGGVRPVGVYVGRPLRSAIPWWSGVMGRVRRSSRSMGVVAPQWRRGGAVRREVSGWRRSTGAMGS